MQISQTGLDLIKRSEGFRAQTYKDVAGFETIGYGHKLQPGEQFPSGVTEEQATALLEKDVAGAESAVNRLVTVPLTQGQFDALVDFTYNLGAAALAYSTLLRDLNAKQYATAGLQILLWDHAVMGGKETEVAGLLARRQAELELWKGNSVPAQPATV